LSPQWSTIGHVVISTVLGLPTLDQESNSALSSTIARLCNGIWNNGPIPALGQSIPLLLEKTVKHPGLWQLRDQVYLLAHQHATAEIISAEFVGHWCLNCSRQIREGGSNLSECQLWLQRAESSGLQATAEYASERAKVEQLLSTPGAESLPRRADRQDSPSDAVGADEQGHLKVLRIAAWVRRLQSLYPWVQGVRRVTADSGLDLFPTRILESSNLARHIRNVQGLSPDRIIPAVLDASYTVGERVLRINILLSEGTTEAQKQAAVARLCEDHSLFPEH